MASIRISLSEGSSAAIARFGRAADELPAALEGALRQGLTETENELKSKLLRGGSPASRRDGKTPLAVRSGRLIGSVTSAVDQPLSGFVGVLSGAGASKYARVQLGSGRTTIRPVNAKHLWIPVGDNLNPSGQMRTSPREAMELRDAQGRRRVRIFKSKRGNLVVFLPDEQGGTFKRGAKKGMQRGRLLFVLKDEVEVQGTDALASAAQGQRDRIRQLLDAAVKRAVSGEGPG
jgi:hypothetical protein